MSDRKPDAGTPATDERCEECGHVECPDYCGLEPTDESAAEDRSEPPPTYAVKETECGDWRSTADGLGPHDDSYQANSYVEHCAIARAAAVAACWAHYDAHPAVAELARVRELGLDGVDREENLKHRLRRAQAERDEARRRADALSQVVQPAWMLLEALVMAKNHGHAEMAELQTAAEPILAKLQSLPQHTVASTDQPSTLSEVTTSTMPRSAPVASEGDGPLGDGGIEE